MRLYYLGRVKMEPNVLNIRTCERYYVINWCFKQQLVSNTYVVSKRDIVYPETPIPMFAFWSHRFGFFFKLCDLKSNPWPSANSLNCVRFRSLCTNRGCYNLISQFHIYLLRTVVTLIYFFSHIFEAWTYNVLALLLVYSSRG